MKMTSDVKAGAGAKPQGVLRELDDAELLLEEAAELEAGSTPVAGSANSHDEDDASIEAYMQGLLSRLNGGAAPVKPAPSAPENKPPVAAELNPAATTVLPASLPPEEPRQPTRAPENRGDLSSMRELANMNARSALGTHSRRGLVQTMQRKFLMILVVAMISCVAAAMSSSVFSVLYGGAVVTMVMAALWSRQFFRLAGELVPQARPSETGHESQPAV